MLYWRCLRRPSQRRKHARRLLQLSSLGLTNVPTIVSGTAPTHILRPLLFRLGQDGVITRLHPRLLQTLHSPVADDCLELTISPQLGDSSGSPYGKFSESVTHWLFGSDTLLQLRLMLAIANFCWVRFIMSLSLSLPIVHVMQELAPSPQMRSEYGEVTRYLLSIISHRILRTFVRQIDCVVHLLASKPPVAQSLHVAVSPQSYLGSDLLFVLRVVIQCMLPGTPQELSAEAQTLADKVTTSFPPSGGGLSGLLEQCPACGVEIPLADTASAVCLNGHRWCEAFMTFDVCPLVLIAPLNNSARCSVTSFVLAGTMVRTCVCCARKAFLPAARSLHRPDDGDVTTGERTSTTGTAEDPIMAEDLEAEDRPGWLVQELLKAVRRCLFCGNNFATLI